MARRARFPFLLATAAAPLGFACGLDVVGTGSPDDVVGDTPPGSRDTTDARPHDTLDAANAVEADGVADRASPRDACLGDACDSACADPGACGFALSVAIGGTAPAGAVVTSSVGGLSCPPTCNVLLAPSTPVTLTATQPAASVLVEWSGGGCVGREPSCSLTMDGPKTTTASFATLTHYVHSSGVLHSADGSNGTLTAGVAFGAGCSGVVGDIAIHRTGAMYAISLDSILYAVAPATGTCTAKGSLGHACNGLAFAPDPTDLTKDALYASCTSELYRVNPTSGQTTLVGGFGSGYSASGDLAYVPGQGVFVTLNGSASDRLGRVDLATGVATLVGTNIGTQSIWGLGHRNGVLLGYANGVVLTIDLTTGLGSVLNGSTGFQAYGAASGP